MAHGNSRGCEALTDRLSTTAVVLSVWNGPAPSVLSRK